MESLRLALLWTHIFFGFLALLAGLIALGSAKGGKTHRRAGTVFFNSMLAVAFSALALASISHNWYLFYIAVFALYQNYSGYRAVRDKSLRPSPLDWLVWVVAVVVAVLMLLTKHLVLLVFGGIMALLTARDLMLFSAVLRGKALPKQQWLIRHIGMMVGAYIATVTAFVVVNLQTFNPMWLPWLAPTALGLPFMAYWMRRTRQTKKQTSVASGQ
ncbi:MAG: DUF2306 domain-containing protein [Saprospiraceae bacterium]|nr:DUF2306 domain-containing protein [Saprospiraceae bacterium]